MAASPLGPRTSALAEPQLRLRLFGRMQVEDVRGQSVLPRSRKARAVLAVLALAAPQPVLRSSLTSLLWSNRAREQARGSLRQSVHELQHSGCRVDNAFETWIPGSSHPRHIHPDSSWSMDPSSQLCICTMPHTVGLGEKSQAGG